MQPLVNAAATPITAPAKKSPKPAILVTPKIRAVIPELNIYRKQVAVGVIRPKDMNFMKTPAPAPARVIIKPCILTREGAPPAAPPAPAKNAVHTPTLGHYATAVATYIATTVWFSATMRRHRKPAQQKENPSASAA